MYAPDKKGELKEERELFMQGRLIGGCMDCLVNLTGTKFDRVGDFLEAYREDGFLWFLETCDLNVFLSEGLCGRWSRQAGLSM